MDSKSIAHYGFNQWYSFGLETKQSVLRLAGSSPGVYVIQHKGNLGRLRGSADILYIGKTTGQNGMKARINAYFNPGPTQLTNKRIHSFLQRQVPMEISFVVKQDPRQLESQLIQQYVTDHDELPPFNRSE